MDGFRFVCLPLSCTPLSGGIRRLCSPLPQRFPSPTVPSFRQGRRSSALSDHYSLPASRRLTNGAIFLEQKWLKRLSQGAPRPRTVARSLSFASKPLGASNGNKTLRQNLYMLN